jgi:ribosomal protein S18 acetylase RimI-like enzyme
MASEETGETPELTPATADDIPAIVTLMNQAYRGHGATVGWSQESGHIEGDRTSEAQLRRDMAAHPNARTLLWRSGGRLRASVWLEPEQGGVWYLGSLAIALAEQNGGLGRTMLAAAERWAERRGAREMRLTVINARTSLIAWYGRRGYRLTGEIEPYPYGDDRFGRPLRDDLAFVILRKQLGQASDEAVSEDGADRGATG